MGRAGLSHGDPAPYLEEVGTRVAAALGARLVGAAAIGSYALGAYVPGRSDLDVLVVADGPLTSTERDAIVASCSHEALPCPAEKLELVVYTREQARAPARDQRWELNLNTGARVKHVGTDPAAEPWHWFVLDLAQAREHAVTLAGDPVAALIGPVEETLVAEALGELLGWYARHEPGEQLLMAAARAWHWHDHRAWAPKREAWAWARERVGG